MKTKQLSYLPTMTSQTTRQSKYKQTYVLDGINLSGSTSYVHYSVHDN